MLPDKYDPDTFILEFGTEVFGEIVSTLKQKESKVLKIKL